MIAKKGILMVVLLFSLGLIHLSAASPSSGAELKVQAVGNAQKAAAGNTEQAAVVVVVTEQGMPVSTLEREHFQVRQVVRPGLDDPIPLTLIFCPPIAAFQPLGEGAYLFRILTENCVWASGDYTFQFRVTRDDQQGQALATIHIPGKPEGGIPGQPPR